MFCNDTEEVTPAKNTKKYTKQNGSFSIRNWSRLHCLKFRDILKEIEKQQSAWVCRSYKGTYKRRLEWANSQEGVRNILCWECFQYHSVLGSLNSKYKTWFFFFRNSGGCSIQPQGWEYSKSHNVWHINYFIMYQIVSAFSNDIYEFQLLSIKISTHFLFLKYMLLNMLLQSFHFFSPLNFFTLHPPSLQHSFLLVQVDGSYI